MARRINTRFVITLGAILALVAGGGAIVVGRRYFLQKDPVYLTKMAEDAEKRGDMAVALQLYDKAVGRSLETHAANAADLCMKVGDMAMKLSDQEKDRARAENLYLMARRSWEKALGENPRYLQARQRLVKEDFQWAEGSAQAALWTSLAENVQKLIALSPNDATAYAYRAEARLQLLLTGAGGTGTMNDTIASIESDLKKAMQLEPKNPQPVILQSQLLWSVKAPLVARPGDNSAALKVQDQGIAALQNFLKQNPNDPDATITLAVYMEQRRRGDEALKVVETAYAAHPENARLANVLALLYQGTDAKKAEKVLKDAIAAAPDNTDEYRQLGDFYERTGKRAEAIATYKELLQHPKPGGGITSYLNDSWEADAKYRISSLYLDMADVDGPGTPTGKSDLAQATEYVDKFRAAKSDVGRQSILDGRLQLAHDNLPQAINYLKRAEANLGGAAPAAGKQQSWMQDKMLLVRAYESQKEWGVALQLLEQVLTNSPQYLQAVLTRAELLNRVAQYE